MPEHWEFRRLKYSVELVNQKVDGSQSDLPYTGLEHIESWTGKRLAQDGEPLSDGQASLYRRGDVLFGKLRPYLAKAYAADGDGICTGELLVLRPRGVQQQFVLAYLLTRDIISVVDSSTYGAKMPRANWDFIGNLPMLIPPPAEQRAIAAFLHHQTAKIDALVEKKRRLIELLKEKRAALISHAVTKGLDRDVPMKDSGNSFVGKIPASWSTSKPKFLCSRIVDGVHHTPNYVDEGIPFVTVKNLTAGDAISFEDTKFVAEDDHKELCRRADPRRGDILITKDGTLGVSRVVDTDRDFSIFVSVALLKPRHDIVDSHYLKFALDADTSAKQFLSRKLGSALMHLHLEEISNITVPLPPVRAQKAIVAEIRAKLKSVDRLIGRVNEAICRLLEYRTALISAAVTGKIDVRNG